MYPTKKLSEILLVLRNGKSCKQTSDSIGDKITRIETISQGNINSDKVGYFQLTSEDKEKYSIEKGDILFSHINSVEHIGKVAIAKQDYDDLFHGMNLLLLRADKNIIDPEFLYTVLFTYFKKGYWRAICKKAINQASLNQKNLNELEIPIPPLPTQSRIVARLDSAFASIDEQISLLRTNIVDVENIRKSVLFDFFGGKNQLLPLSDYVEKLSGIALPEIYKNGNGEGNIPFYKVGEMNNDGLIMKGSTLFFNQELAQTYKIKVFPKGTIVFPKRGGAIFTEKKRILTEEASYDSNVMGLKANNKHLSDEYLFVFMKFIKLGDYADDAGIAQINNKHIDLMKIPLPPLPRQHEIVAHLDRVFATTEALRGGYEAQIRDLETLRQSLLEEAFAGRLVTDEIDLQL